MAFFLALMLAFSPLMANAPSTTEGFEDAGGWMVGDRHLISGYRSMHRFKIDYEKILRWDKKGKAITQVVDSINLVNNPRKGYGYSILGYYYCESPYKDVSLIIALSGQTVVKAWTVVKDKFRPASIKGIKCDVSKFEN